LIEDKHIFPLNSNDLNFYNDLFLCPLFLFKKHATNKKKKSSFCEKKNYIKKNKILPDKIYLFLRI